MARAGIWWNADDAATSELIGRLGGRKVVENAVSAVLPGRTVTLRVLNPGISGAGVFLTSPETVYDFRRVSEVDGVLKIGQARLLADEVDRYEKWVAHVLAHASHFAPLEAPPGLVGIAKKDPEAIQALHYRHVGHTTFGDRVKDLIANGDTTGLCRLIDSLLTILRPWQEMGDPATKPLTSEGVYSFGRDPFDEFESLCERLNSQVAEEDDRIDPAAFRRVRRLWQRDALGAERQLQTIVHGDLHIDNILVDAGNNPTLIDFGATGEGHFLRDLSTLEAHLLLRGLAPKGPRVDAVHRAHVADLESLYSPQAFLDPGLQPCGTPLAAATLRMRRYALYCLMRGDVSYMPQYALGVLRHAVRLCTRADETYTDAQRWASARVAAMLRGTLAVENRRLVLREAEAHTPVNGLAFLDDPPGELAILEGVNAPRTEPCTTAQWEALAGKLRTARRVDLVGIVPTPLVSALLTSWGGLDAEREALPQLRYVTVPAAAAARISGQPIPNWRVALMGMRNLTNIVLDSNVSMDQFAQVTESATTNCVIRASAAGGGSTIYFTGQIAGPGLMDHAHVLSVLPDVDGRVSDMIDTTISTAKPFIKREVDCLPLDGPSAGAGSAGMRSQAFRLSPYGSPASRPPCLRPIALTILRVRAPGGRQVLVKMRSSLVDNDDFGKLSFLSTRILADDVAHAWGKDLEEAEDAEDAFVELWEQIGSPDPFLLTEEVFIQAARRDVYETTLLELGADRFKRRGFLIMNREDNDIQLGFAVLTADLKPAELSAARRAGRTIMDPNGSLLRVMKVDDLLSGRHPVNRVMRERKEWLLENCLGPDSD